MSATLHSYIHFDGNAREAMDFYASVFGGEVHADTFSSFASEEMPVAPEDANKIMHAYLRGDNGIELMAADTPAGMEYTTGSQITLSLSGDDEVLLRGYWNNLSEGGAISVPLGKAPWGDTFGMLTDKFGIEWMVDVRPTESA
jgi:PhnB protein